MGKLFGTDGVRGVANSELTPLLAFNLGRAGAYVLTKENKYTPKILVGMDTRRSGHMLEAALTAGMCSVGATVISAGVIPTPAVAYLTRVHNLDAGVMISASHNPMPDNGIKFFNSQGYKLRDELEDEIEEIMFNGLDSLPSPTGEGVGLRQEFEGALDEYMGFLKSTFKGEDLQGLKVAIDCANGATYEAAPLTLYELNAELSVIHNEPNTCNINQDCGSTHMGSLIEFVKENKMDIGLAFDGDGDRCLCVDENGEIVAGDEIMAICGSYMKEKGLLRSNTIIATIMSNLGLSIMGREHGITIEQTKVGDRYVLERMIEGGFSFGGEASGHMIFLDHNTTGDGILTALQLLSIMKETGKTLSQLKQIMQILPQVLINARVSNEKKTNYLTDEAIQVKIQELENKFAGEGRVVIRHSGTEPLVRIMIEGRDAEVMQRSAEKLAKYMESVMN